MCKCAGYIHSNNYKYVQLTETFTADKGQTHPGATEPSLSKTVQHQIIKPQTVYTQSWDSRGTQHQYRLTG